MDEMPGISHSVSAAILQWFVDREEELRRFREMLTGRDPIQVLVVEGPYGIGKTWLLSRLHGEADAQALPASAVDFSFGEAHDDLWMVHRAAVALGSHHFEALNKTLEDVTKLEVVLKVESSPGSGSVTFHGDAEVHGDVAGRDIIKGNTFYLQADSPVIRRIWQDRINEAFFEDLARLGLASGAIFLFDSFELATNEASVWVKNRLLERIGEGKLPGVRVVIACEQVPNLPSAWPGLVEELPPLGPLPAADVRKYLKDKRQLVISEANIATIYEITDGRPDLVALIAQSNPKRLPEEPDKDRLLEILVKGILKKAEAPIPETLRKAAIAEWFDAALLADLLETTTGVDDRLADLQVYSFVYADERGHLRFSPTVRQVLLKTWAEQPTEFRELHDRAARHFDERARHAADPRECEELERQAVGHWLVIDERAGRDRLCALFEESEDSYRLAACQLLLQRAEAVEDLTDLTQAWLRYLQGRLALARNDYKRSAALFGALLEETDPDSELHPLAGWRLGQVAAEQGEWEKAIIRYESSLQYFTYFTGRKDRAREGQVMLDLGDVHLQQARALGGPIRPQLLRRRGRWRFVEAIPAFLVALPFVVYAWAIRRWRFLPPLHHGMNYRNWTLARLLLTAVRWYRDAESVFAETGHVASRDEPHRGWYRDAESVFAETGQEALLADARQRLAQTYHRLGWWHAARRLFDHVLRTGPVVTNAYRQAQVRKEVAETELAAGNTDEAIEQIEKGLETFERYQDLQAQAEAQRLLGQAWMQKGQFERGLVLYRQSLEGFSAIGDGLGTGLALHALRRWTQRSDPTPDQAAQVEALIAGTQEKTYLPRVPDRLAAVLEFAVSISLFLLAFIGLTTLGIAELTPARELFAHLFSIGTMLRFLGRIVLFTWIYIIGSGLLGLLLIVWGAQRKLEPERLDRIVTSDDAISRVDYRGQEMSRIPWREVQAIVSVERVLCRTPSSLLSEFWLFGPKAVICVPATMLWYNALKRDIEDHLREHNTRPVRRRLDVHVLWSWMGLLFALCPVLLGLAIPIVRNLVELPISLELAAFAGPVFMILGVVALVAGPYWWLVLHPLWVRYELAPQSRTPLVVGGLGLIIIAFAFGLSYLHPFFPIRNWMDVTVHPLGFLLIIVALLWVLVAREWAQKPVVRGRPVYQPLIRTAATIVLLGAVVLTGLFVQREWIPYFYIFRAVTHFSRGAYQSTIVDSTQALAMNADLADGYYFRARAYSKLGEHERAVNDLSHLIESRSITVASYLLFRAQAYKALDNPKAACADLRSVLGARRWRLSEQRQKEAQDARLEWNCDSFKDITEDGEGSSP
jgi:tetratricopeptide (TPR) repeat protein